MGRTLEEIAALFGDEVAVGIQEAGHSAVPLTGAPSDEKITSEAVEAEQVEDIGGDHRAH